MLDVINVQPPLANGEQIKSDKDSWSPQANGKLIKSNKGSWSPQIEKGEAERKLGRRARRPRKWV